MEGSVIFIILLVAALFIAFKSIRIVSQSDVLVIERLGKYYKNAEAGVNILIPFLDRVRAKVSLRQQTMHIPPQGVITKDNVTITIDTVVFFQITDPFKAIYEIESLQRAISYVSVTTMRDIIGKMDLDSTFSSRDLINTQLRDILDEATDKWGVKVERVEVKDIRPPADIRDAMEKQMNAERNKRAAILEAQGERESAITRADGDKEAAILNAEAEKEANIRRAEGVRQAKILEANGEAEAIRQIAEAKAQEVALVFGAIREAKPDDRLVAIKSLEALEKVADGSANKVFIPFDATKTLASVSAMVEAKN